MCIRDRDCIIGKTLSVEQLEEEGFKGIFVASGAGLPNFMTIPGENSINILSSNEYLTRVNLMDVRQNNSFYLGQRSSLPGSSGKLLCGSA